MADKNIEIGPTELGTLIRRLEQNYVSGSGTLISKYVNFYLGENIAKIDAYLNSKHISGEFDSLGREKPFFNIVTAASNIWYRATDIDRKNIKIKADREQNTLTAFLASVYLHEWMKRENFGTFLNEWGRILARYGSSVVKFVRQGGRLVPIVVPWNRLIIDPIDFDAAPVIEVLELTEAQLRKRKGYDQDLVDKLCDARQNRETLQKQNQENTNAEYIKLYEVHGELPLSYLTGNPDDEDEYVQQMQVLTFIQSKEDGKFDDYVLVKGREINPFMITHLIKEDGRVQGIGAVEHLFNAQWMMNHTVKSIKDQLDLASKLIFQTSDGNYVGQNALTAIENGDIMVHEVNMPLTQIQNNSHDITSLQSFGNQWNALGQQVTNTPDALRGIQPPAGTAWRQVQAIQGEATSLFELMTENKGLHIEEMLRTFVIPFLKTKMGNSKQIAATLEAHDIDKIDSIYVPKEAARQSNKQIIDQVLHPDFTTVGSPVAQQPNINQIKQGIQDKLSSQGDQRFFVPSEISDKTWKDIFNDFEWVADVDVTGEDSPDKDDLATLTTVLQTISTNPRVLSDPNAKIIFNKILSIAGGISPVELGPAVPYVPMPSRKFTETLDYKDAPDDVKRQIEEQAGLQPSQQNNNPVANSPGGGVGAMVGAK